MKLGNKILKLRKSKGISQEELGEKIGVTRQTISNWELGVTSPNPEQLKLLSHELNISIDEMLDNNISMNKTKNISNSEKLSSIILKVFKVNIIIILIIVVLVIILFTMRKFKVNNGRNVLESINCNLYGEEHGYTILYGELTGYPNKVSSDGYFNDILDLEKYNNAHQIFNIINDYVKKNGGTCQMITDNDLTDIVNIYIKDGTLTKTSATIVINDYNPNRIVYGSEFWIEKYNNGEWDSIETLGNNYGFNSMAYYVDENGVLEMKQDWSYIYGELDNGIYRLVKDAFFESSSPLDEYNKYYIWTEFEIE